MEVSVLNNGTRCSYLYRMSIGYYEYVDSDGLGYNKGGSSCPNGYICKKIEIISCETN